MTDLPRTPLRLAEAAEEAARAAGLERVRIGNRHLLSGAPNRRQNDTPDTALWFRE